MKAKSLLIDEYPLLVLPSLAMEIGLNEAIALQQLHYWLGNPKGGVEMNGERWVYNTYENWKKDNFPFWSVRTIIRVFDHLEEMGLVISTQKASYNRKKYYRIHYDKLATWNMTDCQDASCQDVNIDNDKVASSLTETKSETKSESTRVKRKTAADPRSSSPEISLYKSIRGQYPKKHVYDIVIKAIQNISARLGRDATRDDILPFWESWASHSTWNPDNLAWLKDWAVSGIIPDRPTKQQTPSEPRGIAAAMNWLQKSEAMSNGD